jgi:hypothetical protein
MANLENSELLTVTVVHEGFFYWRNATLALGVNKFIKIRRFEVSRALIISSTRNLTGVGVRIEVHKQFIFL